MNDNISNILLIDSASKNMITRISDVSNEDLLSKHTVKIANILASDIFEMKNDNLSRIISVSYFDAISKGYGETRKDVAKKFGACQIEAHAYSSIDDEFNSQLQNSFSELNDPSNRPYILASVGHDFGRQRFPGSCEQAIGVAIQLKDGKVTGRPPIGNGNIEFIVKDFNYATVDEFGNKTTTHGTSAAVVYLAGMAAALRDELIFSNLSSDALAIHAGMICMSTMHLGMYLFDEHSCKNSLPKTSILEIDRSKSATLKISSKNFESFKKLSIVASDGNEISRSTKLVARVANSEVLGERGTLLISNDAIEEVENVEDNSIYLSLNGLIDRITIASYSDINVEIINNTLVKKKGDEVIIGINGSHDASACLMINGKLVNGIQLERLTRVKHDGRNTLDTSLAAEYCLKAAGLKKEDVDCFAFNIQSAVPEYDGLSQPINSQDFKLFDPYSDSTIVVSHHLCHAMASWSGSNFVNGNAVVIDGSGGTVVNGDDFIYSGKEFFSYLSNGIENYRPSLHVFSHYLFSEDGFKLINREYSPSFNIRNGSKSIGETYASVSQFVFNSWQDSGKLMGLAPYGKPIYKSQITEKSNGEITYGYKWKSKFIQKTTNPMDYADLASSVQEVLEDSILSKFNKYGIDNKLPLTLTGGVALNSVANYKIRRNLNLKDFYLFPAQHDAGVSIGAACAASYKRNGKILNNAFSDDFLGRTYPISEVAMAINKFSDRVKVLHSNPIELASRLNNGEILGYFSCKKGSEFGPRALGARSLLASPCSIETWKFINKWVKYREDFRPFAPMVATEYLEEYFQGKGEYKYMLEVLPVKEKYRSELAAITHVDGTARVQTVSQRDDIEIHNLLIEFSKLSGFPVLLNTSFNVRGQPIVEEPFHAIEMLLSTHIDAVVFDNYIVQLRDLEINQEEIFGVLKLSPGCFLSHKIEKNESKHYINHKFQGLTNLISKDLYDAISSLLKASTLKKSEDIFMGLPFKIRNQITRYVKLKCFNLALDFSDGKK
ncbi:carbamoyltransferase C-terminal domain-containing protein [Erwiniaceae bacterium L1_55_4]|nr:carbamoyltransferase C-terminal domain-containing protein [Erwiniaceae bacterium L1_55_4]